MPVTIKQNKVKFKHPTQQGFIEFNSISEPTTAELQKHLRQVGQEVKNTIPKNYETLNNRVNNIVKFSDTQPNTEATQIWVDTSNTTNAIAVPTMQEFNNLKDQVENNTIPSGNIGDGLPSVTSSDEGKVLQVQNGEWTISDSIKKKFDELTIQIGSVESLSWAERMEYVRAGDGPKLFPVGTQFVTPNHVLGNIIWDVVDHDHFHTANNPTGHTMTLLIHYALYDRKRTLHGNHILLATEYGMPAGNYKFECKGRTRQQVISDMGQEFYFTLPVALEPTWQLRAYDETFQYNKTYDGCNLAIYQGPDKAEPMKDNNNQDIVIKLHKLTSNVSLNNLIDLGVQGETQVCLDPNDSSKSELLLIDGHFFESGVVDYDLCDLRMWLNSNASEPGGWWDPNNLPTKWSRVQYAHNSAPEQNPNDLPNYRTNEPGFMSGFDPQFLNCIIKAQYPCIASHKYSLSHPVTVGTNASRYYVEDYFTLPSISELGLELDGSAQNVGHVGTVLAYFEGASNTQRLRHFSADRDQTRGYWSRQTEARQDYYYGLCSLRGVSIEGKAITLNACTNQCVVIMCTLG